MFRLNIELVMPRKSKVEVSEDSEISEVEVPKSKKAKPAPKKATAKKVAKPVKKAAPKSKSKKEAVSVESSVEATSESQVESSEEGKKKPISRKPATKAPKQTKKPLARTTSKKKVVESSVEESVGDSVEVAESSVKESEATDPESSAEPVKKRAPAKKQKPAKKSAKKVAPKKRKETDDTASSEAPKKKKNLDSEESEVATRKSGKKSEKILEAADSSDSSRKSKKGKLEKSSKSESIYHSAVGEESLAGSSDEGEEEPEADWGSFDEEESVAEGLKYLERKYGINLKPKKVDLANLAQKLTFGEFHTLTKMYLQKLDREGRDSDRLKLRAEFGIMKVVQLPEDEDTKTPPKPEEIVKAPAPKPKEAVKVPPPVPPRAAPPAKPSPEKVSEPIPTEDRVFDNVDLEEYEQGVEELETRSEDFEPITGVERELAEMEDEFKFTEKQIGDIMALVYANPQITDEELAKKTAVDIRGIYYYRNHRATLEQRYSSILSNISDRKKKLLFK